MLKFLAVGFFGVYCAWNACAVTWSRTSAPTNYWYSVVCSAGGTTLVATGDPVLNSAGTNYETFYTSTDSGATWVPFGGLPWGLCYVTLSADGNKVCLADSDGDIVTSTNLFYTEAIFYSGYYAFPVGGGPFSLDGCWGLCGSTDGSRLFAMNDSICSSTDLGATWTGISTASALWTSFACSADGTKLVAGSFYYNEILRSTDSGITWLPIGPTNALQWGPVACSADGCTIAATINVSSTVYSNGNYVNVGGPIYTSTNSGATWTLASLPWCNWQAVACSVDGTKLVAAPDQGPLYTSCDSGATWQASDVQSTSWKSVAMSADGGKMLAAEDGGGIWTAQTVPSPQLSLAMSETKLLLSWTVPSINFVVQQNGGLTSAGWITLTNQPTLDFSNLNDEVCLPLSSSNSFFRLVSQ